MYSNEGEHHIHHIIIKDMSTVMKCKAEKKERMIMTGTATDKQT